MKLADDYSLRDNWQSEVEKHMRVLNCSFYDALQVLAEDILIEEDPNYEPLDEEHKEQRDKILQQIGVDALLYKYIEVK